MSAPNVFSMSRRAAMIAGALLAATGAARAQQASASVAGYGMAGNYTAVARGYDAVAWNPANLGLPGNPRFSISLLTAGGNSGVNPVDLGAFKQYQNVTLPQSVKQSWMDQVKANGGESGRANGGLSIVALSAGPLAVQVSTTGYMYTKMTPDAFQALMFGNAGLTGSPQALNFAGSRFDAAAFTTAAGSVAIPIVNAPGSHFAFGVTGKYVIGNFVVHALDGGSAVNLNDVQVRFPVVCSTCDTAKTHFQASDAVAGVGVGVDVGMAYAGDRLTWTAVLQNAINTFAWDSTKLFSRAGSASFDGTTNTTDFDQRPYSQAPQSLKDQIANDKFKPVVATGIAYKWKPSLTVTADVRQQLGDGIDLGPKSQVGGGVEFRGVPVLPLRFGASYITGGWSAAAGVGLRLGPYELGVAGMLRNRDSQKETGVMVGLVSVH